MNFSASVDKAIGIRVSSCCSLGGYRGL